MSIAMVSMLAAAANPHKLCAASANESKQAGLRRHGGMRSLGGCRAASGSMVAQSRWVCSCWAFFDHQQHLSSFTVNRIDRKLAARAEKSGRDSEEKGELNKTSEMADMWERISTSAKIFSMAFFWVFLFFGASAWDGKSTGGKSRRGPPK